MADDSYSVKINRRDGVVEITGPDKEWIAEQLDRLAVVYEGPIGELDDPPPHDVPEDKAKSKAPSPDEGNGTPRRRSRGSSVRANRLPEFEAQLTKDVRDQLEAYVDERKANFAHAPEQAVIIATFLEDNVGINGISVDELYTVFLVMGWRAPNPRNALENARQRKNYFGSQQDGRYHLTHTGERFGRHDSKAAAE